MSTKFEPHECVNFVQSTKIGTNVNKDIRSNFVSTRLNNPAILTPFENGN